MKVQFMIGIDEVGRGSLAGPITVAAVAAATNQKSNIKNKKLRTALLCIKDSKKLSPKQREGWFRNLSLLTSHSSLVWAISSVGSTTIDRIGISRAATLAVGRCLRKLKIKYKKSKIIFQVPCVKIMLDGSLYAPRTYQNQKTIIKGDERIPLIAAASIIAKVTRDRMMTCWHSRYPRYGFATHKGYGTAMHRAALARYGFCMLHRRSFCKNLNGKL
ncbi:MAG TPA: ribonuclease HII [Candidatus Paceibacterota bacterium]